MILEKSLIVKIRHVILELWSPITFEMTTYLIIYIDHSIRLTDLNKNMLITKGFNGRFGSYGLPKFNNDMGGNTYFYVK